ncbi:hypothetical protein FJM65_08030 [Pontibacter mangrovi]|uniref:Myosin N-terminal SH3-like domain-containing protein n=1 Tax=Pontibacter mangrovi TaxID=2589816 RepID=A0A501WA58_9BACT|nr:hypothetical protein FJM65_08030 [Pontibacter mangrovi]
MKAGDRVKLIGEGYLKGRVVSVLGKNVTIKLDNGKTCTRKNYRLLQLPNLKLKSWKRP